MTLNEKNPSFTMILNNIVNEIISSVSTLDYFSLNDEQKFVIQETSFRIIRNTINYNVSLSDDDTKVFLKVLQKKNEQNEHYEVAQILNDVFTNYSKFKLTNKKGNKNKIPE